ncbi:MAG: twin transmembrane helix small protein [Gammaproteobacteria bacterium]|nr:twin transmembrane helix small protein [Gammaproteobacteria bacterium]
MQKLIVIITLLVILGSLGSALFFMMKDHDDSDRMVKALTWRVGLSVGLFAFLMLGQYAGWFQPNIR